MRRPTGRTWPLVQADAAGRLLWTSPAFVELCEAASEARLEGRPLADARGGDALRWATLLVRVRSRGGVGQAAVMLHPQSTSTRSSRPGMQVGVSAALLAEGDQKHIGPHFAPCQQRWRPWALPTNLLSMSRRRCPSWAKSPCRSAAAWAAA